MKSVTVTSLVITVVISTHFSRVESRDLLQHLGKVKAGLVQHLAGKFSPHKKVSPIRTFHKNPKRQNTINIHRTSTSKTHSRQSQGLTPTKSISISSHAFLTPNFDPINSGHIPSIHNNQKQRIVKNNKVGRTSGGGGTYYKKSSNISVPTTYRKQTLKHQRNKNKNSKHIGNQNHKHNLGIKRNKLKSLPKLKTSDTTPVFTASKSQDHHPRSSDSFNKRAKELETSQDQESRNEIEVFKESKKNKSHDKLIIDDDDSLVPVIRESLWREDLVGRVLTA